MLTCDIVETDGQFTNADAWCLEHDAPVNDGDRCVAAPYSPLMFTFYSVRTGQTEFYRVAQ